MFSKLSNLCSTGASSESPSSTSDCATLENFTISYQLQLAFSDNHRKLNIADFLQQDYVRLVRYLYHLPAAAWLHDLNDPGIDPAQQDDLIMNLIVITWPFIALYLSGKCTIHACNQGSMIVLIVNLFVHPLDI